MIEIERNSLPLVNLRSPVADDEPAFLAAMQQSRGLHAAWVNAPQTPAQFKKYLHYYRQDENKSLLVCTPTDEIAGVLNISHIIKRVFQNAYIGFFATAKFSGKGYMSAGMKKMLQIYFKMWGLHRLEANIQPSNIRSIQFVKRLGFQCVGFSPRYLQINDVWCGHEHWVITYEDYIRDDADVRSRDRITLVSYDTAWPAQAQAEMKKLRQALPAEEILDMQHVGSTAIPDMAAKSIIDIQIAVRSLACARLVFIPMLQKLGYEFWTDNPDPTRLFFVKGMPPYGKQRTHHVHIAELNSPAYQDKIIFRDYLRLHPQEASAYLGLKQELATQHSEDREKYTEAKLAFVQHILQLARC